jgi:hypothetical protein
VSGSSLSLLAGGNITSTTFSNAAVTMGPNGGQISYSTFSADSSLQLNFDTLLYKDTFDSTSQMALGAATVATLSYTPIPNVNVACPANSQISAPGLAVFANAGTNVVCDIASFTTLTVSLSATYGSGTLGAGSPANASIVITQAGSLAFNADSNVNSLVNLNNYGQLTLESGSTFTTYDAQITNEAQATTTMNGISTFTANSNLYTNQSLFVSKFWNQGRLDATGTGVIAMAFVGTGGTLVVNVNSAPGVVAGINLGTVTGRFDFSWNANNVNFHGSYLECDDSNPSFNFYSVYNTSTSTPPNTPGDFGLVFAAVISLGAPFNSEVNGYFNEPANYGTSSFKGAITSGPLTYYYNNGNNILVGSKPVNKSASGPTPNGKYPPRVSYITLPRDVNGHLVYTVDNPRIWSSLLSVYAGSTSLVITPFILILSALYLLF